MPSDQTVSAKAVLAAVLEIQRRGPTPALQHLEQVEPDLANYLMETLSVIHQRLTALNGPPKTTQRAFLEVQSLALVCITALQKSHYELWRQDGGDVEPAPDRQ